MRGHDAAVRVRALALLAQGRKSVSVALELGVSDSTIRNWKRAGACVDCGTPLGDLGSERCDACAPTAATFWTRELIIERVRLFVERYGRTPRAIDWNPQMAIARGCPELAKRFYEDACWPLQAVCQRRAGSLNRAVELAGYSPRPSGHRVGMRPWPREAILAAIQEWVRVHGETPTHRQWAQSGADHPTASCVERAFGNWNAAIAAAGFATRAKSEHRPRMAAKAGGRDLRGRVPAQGVRSFVV